MGNTTKTAVNAADCSINNIYRLEGRVPITKAIPFGLQHILAMFVSNLAPITIIAGASRTPLTPAQLGMLLQNAMFVAGIATLIQLYPHLARRLEAAGGHGRQLYLCNGAQRHFRQLRLSGRRGSRAGRRSV